MLSLRGLVVGGAPMTDYDELLQVPVLPTVMATAKVNERRPELLVIRAGSDKPAFKTWSKKTETRFVNTQVHAISQHIDKHANNQTEAASQIRKLNWEWVKNSKFAGKHVSSL
jgi:hypothetical protein